MTINPQSADTAAAKATPSREASMGETLAKDVLEGAVTSYWEWFPAEDKVIFSNGFSKTLGLRDNVSAMNYQEWMTLLEPEDVPRAMMAMRNHITSGGRLPYRLEVRYRHRGGGTVWMLSNARTVSRDENGKPTRIIGTHNDISDRKRLEESLRSVMEALDSRNEELASYSFITAHDLRSPVTSIVSLMDMYKQEPTGENAEFVLDNIGDLARDLLDTLDTLNEVLNVKRRPDVIMEQVLLKPMFDAVTETFSRRIEREGARIESSLDCCPSVIAYAPYMESILRNLLSNALRFRSPDRAPQIRFESEHFRNHSVLRFADNGIGIDMSRHGRKLFGLKQRFHQADGSRGVGLFMIKAQVEAMKGSITVSSRVDEGTIFTIYLPNNS
ncbi:MAG: PAS domain-containing sensor histidine kinase [Opitutales bacterium]|nr:PAS domain-containing sensor histidine kinase [Opitutales bacterium]